MPKFEALPKAVKPKDLTGLRFGNLLIIDFSHRQRTEYATRIFWNCLCDCGIQRQVQTYHLTNEEVKSCGKCNFTKVNRKAAAKKLPFGEGALRSYFRSYKANAIERELCFEINYDEFTRVTSLNCHYCNALPATRLGYRNGNGPCIANGVDRKDNTTGYTGANCLPCCTRCNLMKLDTPYDVFVCQIKTIAKHLGSL